MFNSELLTNFSNFQTAGVDQRAEFTYDVCTQFARTELQDRELSTIHDILTFITMDTEESIRAIISATLKDSDKLPNFIAKQLANDVDSVSMPIIEFSQSLTDQDLQEIIRSTGEVAKLHLIAKRKNLSQNVSYTLVNRKIEEVTTTLLNNPTAQIGEKSQELIFTIFKESRSILDLLVTRGGLSPTLATKMFSYVSSNMAEKLVQDYNISVDEAKTAIQQVDERFTVQITPQSPNQGQVNKLVTNLHNDGKLNSSMILRALANGNLDFFYCGLSKLADIEYKNAIKLLQEGDKYAFSKLFLKAQMPSTMEDASHKILQLNLKCPNLQAGSDELYQYLLDKITEKEYNKDIPNMQYFISLINNMQKENKYSNV